MALMLTTRIDTHALQVYYFFVIVMEYVQFCASFVSDRPMENKIIVKMLKINEMCEEYNYCQLHP